MANLYGVANNIGMPYYTGLVGGTNVVCAANAETIVADSGLIVAPSNGYFVPVWAGVLIITFGATIPTNLSLAAKIGGGSDFTALTVPPNFFIASSNAMVPFFFAGPSSQVAWQAPGSHCFLTVNVGAQPVTAVQANSVTVFWLVRGPDQ